ncbi:MAG: AMP-binding protein [Planctomycetota bacterium]
MGKRAGHDEHHHDRRRPPSLPLLSAIEGIDWPPILDPQAARLLAYLQYLDRSQWLPGEALRDRQRQQLRRVVQHAVDTVPWYQERLAAAAVRGDEEVSPERWRAIPLLSRADVQDAGDALRSRALPRSHGEVARLMTSGATAEPVVVLSTDVTRFLWSACTIRDHLWHGRDFDRSLAVIRYARRGVAEPPDGKSFADWRAPTHGITSTGPCHLLSIDSTVDEQAAWLRRVQPNYLLSYATVLRSLCEHFSRNGGAPTSLREVCSFGEIVEPDLRHHVERVFGVPLVDMYSAQEVGYIALQCPESTAYHVQAENVLVEVLDDDGHPCQPGEVGRVVVTTLHNFASPLLRYDIGDFAEVGDACTCGRGLPVLRRVLGRQRNMLTLRDGRRRWPSFALGGRPEQLPPFRKVQLLQRSLEEIEVRVVRDTPLEPAEMVLAEAYLNQSLGQAFRYVFRVVDDIPRSGSGKFEDFVSAIDAAAAATAPPCAT